MIKLKNIISAFAFLATLYCPHNYKNPDSIKPAQNTSLENRVDKQVVRKNAHKLLNSLEESYYNEQVSLTKCLPQLQSTKASLEKINGTKTADYVNILTSLASVYKALALEGMENTLPQINFPKNTPTTISIKKRDTAESKKNIHKKLEEARNLYEKAIKIIQDNPSLELKLGEKISPFYGLGHTCRVLQDFDCSRKAYQTVLKIIPSDSKFKEIIEHSLKILNKDEEDYEEYQQRKGLY